MKRLEGKVALITGGGSGIARRASELFAEEGARVAIADIDEEAGRKAAREIGEAGGQVIFVRTDMTEPDSVEAAVRETVRAFGKLDTLYNNVGGTNPKDAPVTTVPLEVFWATMKRDLFGTFLGCRFAIPEIIKAGGGAVVSTASVVALRGKELPSQVCYTAAKGGIVAMTRAMAVEYAPHKVRVNAIAPGITLTERVQRLVRDRPERPPAMSNRHLLGLMEPSDIAYAALYLVSEEARRITGQILPVDSGVTMA